MNDDDPAPGTPEHATDVMGRLPEVFAAWHEYRQMVTPVGQADALLVFANLMFQLEVAFVGPDSHDPDAWPVTRPREHPASEDSLDRHAARLVDLGVENGLTNLRVAGPGRLVVRVGEGRTYFDLARFEMFAAAVVDAHVEAVPDEVSAARTAPLRVLGAPVEPPSAD